MDSWETLIIQWINGLHENSNDYICNIQDLKDGRIYCKLIYKLKSWNSKLFSDSKKDIIFEFLKDEYPNFTCSSNVTDDLCIGLLILSRLSLEPIFHKSLCVNLSYDLQIKVKSILETMYALGKDVTADDLCRTFSLSEKTDFKSMAKRSKHILEDFLNSPVVRSVQSEKKMYEQTKHIRHLRADIETLRYEKSELIEDIKFQKKQINELQNKLHETVSELKLLRADTTMSKHHESFQEEKDFKSIEMSYKNELHSLEKYVTELQNDNCKLQDEKNDLINEMKLYKLKCRTVEEKNMNNNEIIESMLLQMEKKDDEVADFRMKYEELRNYFKEKSMQLSNQSIEVDDRTFPEISFNKSEALSSVIEIQLQDTKKDLMVMQNKFININSILNAVIEEYAKVKNKYDILFSLNMKMEDVKQSKCEKCDLKKEETENLVEDNENVISLKSEDVKKEQYVISKLMTGKEIKIRNSIKLSLSDIFKNNFSYGNNSVIMELINQSNRITGIKKLNNNIFALRKNKNEDLLACKDSFYNSTNLSENNGIIETSTPLEVYKRNKNINYVNNINIVVQFCKMLTQENWNNQLSDFVQILNRFIKTETGIEDEENNKLHKAWSSSYKNSVCIQNSLPKNIEMNCSRCTQTETEYSKLLSFYKINIKYLQSLWRSLNELAFYTFKIHKVLLFLNKHWDLTLNSSIDIIDKSKTQFECKKLLEIKYIIETELKHVYWRNLQTLSFTLMNSVQFVTLLSNSSDCLICSNENLQDWLTNQLFSFDLTNHEQSKLQHQNYMANKIIAIKRRINNFINLTNLVEKKCSIPSQEPVISEDEEKKYNVKLMQCDIKPIQDEKEISINKTPIEEEKKISDDIKPIKDEKEISINKTPIQEEKKISADETSIQEEKKISVPKKPIQEEDIIQSQQFKNYIKEMHEKYELKLEKMKEKMKSVYNNQISTMKEEQKMLAMKELEALQLKFKNQCYNHTEELQKYKKHISELSTQLWDVGEKLIIEKQKKEDVVQKLKEIRNKSENIESLNPKSNKHDQENYDNSIVKSEKAINALQSIENTSIHKMQSVRGFQIMGNAFRTEDEEGEVFDTTYLTDMQRSRNSISSADLNRLSILQIRNSKCKPHLKSSYPGELQIHPVPFSEDEIKTGSTSEEVFNDSLSQSLLTGKKVKRSNRTRTTVETPRKNRRFSNIFRKTRLSSDRK